MSRLSFTEALDQALELLEQGYPLEYCIHEFPEYSDELRPLLQVSADLHSLADVSFSSFEKTSIEPNWEALLNEVPQQPKRRLKTLDLGLGQIFTSLQHHPIQRFASLGAALVILFMLVWRGTNQSAPNTLLYPIKRTVERVELVAAQNPAERISLHIEFANRRLDELRSLAHQERAVDRPLMDALLQQTRGAIEQVKQGGVNEPAAYEQLVVLLAKTDASISELKQIGGNEPSGNTALLEDAAVSVADMRGNLADVVAAADMPTTPSPVGTSVTPTSTGSKLPVAVSATIAPTPMDEMPYGKELDIGNSGQGNTAPSIPTARPATSTTTTTQISPTTAATATPTSAPTTVRTEVASATRTPVLTTPTASATAKPITQVPATPTPATPAVVPTEISTKPTIAQPVTPTAQPTVVPTEVSTEPTIAQPTTPTTQPTVWPTNTPTAIPIYIPTSTPTNTPTSVPTSTPTVEPTTVLSPTPTVEPTTVLSPTPTAEPIETVTPSPVQAPTETVVLPTAEPTVVLPTAEPTVVVTTEPPSEVVLPTATATGTPGEVPTSEATPAPVPSEVVTDEPVPTTQPTEPIGQPVEEPTPSPETPIPTVTVTVTTVPTIEGPVETPVVTVVPTEVIVPEPTSIPPAAGGGDPTPTVSPAPTPSPEPTSTQPEEEPTTEPPSITEPITTASQGSLSTITTAAHTSISVMDIEASVIAANDVQVHQWLSSRGRETFMVIAVNKQELLQMRR